MLSASRFNGQQPDSMVNSKADKESGTIQPHEFAHNKLSKTTRQNSTPVCAPCARRHTVNHHQPRDLHAGSQPTAHRSFGAVSCNSHHGSVTSSHLHGCTVYSCKSTFGLHNK